MLTTVPQRSHPWIAPGGEFLDDCFQSVGFFGFNGHPCPRCVTHQRDELDLHEDLIAVELGNTDGMDLDCAILGVSTTSTSR
jgi:hypothetical protein